MLERTWGPGHRSGTLFFSALFLLLSLLCQSPAEASGKTVTIEATGTAAVSGSNAALARDSAIADALRKAVEQAVGAMVSSDTVVESYQVLRDSIYTNTQGYVRGYSVTGESRSADTYTVTVRAAVATGDIEGDLDDIGLLHMKAERPRVFFMIEEKEMGEGDDAFWRGTSGVGAPRLPASEAALKEAFLAKGFEVADRTGGLGMTEPPVEYGPADLTGEAAMRAGRAVDAGIVVFGKAVVSPRRGGGEVVTYLADITAQAVRADDGSVIASARAQGASRHISGVTGPADALKNASTELARGLMTQITAKWSGPGRVTITLKGAPDYAKAAEFKRLLRSRVRGIEAVFQRRFDGGVAYFEADSRVPAQLIADEISTLDGYRVTGTTQNTIEVEAGN